jgi:hypothetical protein
VQDKTKITEEGLSGQVVMVVDFLSEHTPKNTDVGSHHNTHLKCYGLHTTLDNMVSFSCHGLHTPLSLAIMIYFDTAEKLLEVTINAN